MAKKPEEKEPQQDGGFTLVKKMSSKTVYGSRLMILEAVMAARETSKPAPLFDVVGIARDIARGETPMGPWLAFIGEFHAKSYNPLLSGKTFYSGRLFLGGPAGDLLLGQMSPHGENHVEFAFTIQAQIDEASATGYTYQAVPLIQPSGDTPLERLKRKLSGGMFKALPAPKPETDKA